MVDEKAIESNLIEYKSDLPKKNKMKAEIVSFLNSRGGGTILLGIDDDGNAIDFSNEYEKRAKYKEWEETLSNWIATAFVPEVFGLIHVDANEDEFRITISSGNNKPYYYKDGEGFNGKGIYIRSGSSKRRASEDEIRRMMINHSPNTYEERISDYKTLDMDYVKNRFRKEGLEFDAVRLGLRKKNENYNMAGVIVSDENPFVTKVAMFDGLNVMKFRDKKKYDGPIIRQINSVMDYLYMVNKEEVIFTGQPTRISNYDYPEKALREAVLNAFCHRDYTIPMDIKVEIYDDRIRIMSPGSIPAGLTLDAIKTGANAKRNPLIVNVLDKAGLIENYGAGIMRILESYEGFEKQPLIEAMEDLFIITLYNMKYHTNSNNHQYIKTNDYSAIIDYLSKNEFASRRNIEESLNLKKSRTGLLLQKMVEEDIIEKVGSGPSTKYTLRK